MANKADVKREDFRDHPMQAQSKFNLVLAGKNLAPWGFEHQASFAVHFYQKPGSHDFVFISQMSGIDNLPEGQVDIGLKELRRSLMGVYGREDVRRKDV